MTRSTHQRVAHALAASLVAGALSLLVACATSTPAAVYRIEAAPPDAQVWIDDKLVGKVSDFATGKRLPPGFHRIEIRHPGYYSAFEEVEPRPGEEVRVQAPLHELIE